MSTGDTICPQCGKYSALCRCEEGMKAQKWLIEKGLADLVISSPREKDYFYVSDAIKLYVKEQEIPVLSVEEMVEIMEDIRKQQKEEMFSPEKEKRGLKIDLLSISFKRIAEAIHKAMVKKRRKA